MLIVLVDEAELSAKICSSNDVKEVGIDQAGLDDQGMGVDFRRGRVPPPPGI